MECEEVDEDEARAREEMNENEGVKREWERLKRDDTGERRRVGVFEEQPSPTGDFTSQVH